MHPGQDPIVERLNAERDAIYACGLPVPDVRRRNVFRIGLESDLRVLPYMSLCPDGFHEAGHTLAAELGRRSPAEVQRLEVEAARRMPRFDLRQDLVDILVRRHH
jgi:hypothetical protein